MEKKLQKLFALQQIDSALDQLQEEKGDLPAEVRNSENRLEELKRKISDLEELMKSQFAKRDITDLEIITLKEKVEKYKEQQFHVRNNKEYDALTKEMDFAAESIVKKEKEMELLEANASLAREDIERTKPEIEEVIALLAEKREQLAEVSKATEVEELKFQHERDKLVARINKADLATYERIRGAKNGIAIVQIDRGACGGCLTKVPPQKVLELRQSNILYTCERCGRIIVSDETAKQSVSVT